MTRTTAERLRTLEIVFLVAVGGFAGANLRYVFSLAIPGLGGTFAANVLGCLALGFLVYEAELVGLLAEETGFVAATGFLSSFTTYSTFALEAVQSPTLTAVGYVAATYVCGFGAVLVGRRLARLLEGVV
ncbi:fluoride efflux transporter FluC [Haloplanus halophilus]|uniref:fluoride efflux transporter FluC n=1 Tax=Haloplanus halophilus TaxID=2949993 RepID=UPI00203DA25C|nr:CrcB family protein [Haloplanus sp. GDY1]